MLRALWWWSQAVCCYPSSVPSKRDDDQQLISFNTGGSGLGLILAKTLESNGAKVYITGRNEEKLQAAAKTAVCYIHLALNRVKQRQLNSLSRRNTATSFPSKAAQPHTPISNAPSTRSPTKQASSTCSSTTQAKQPSTPRPTPGPNQPPNRPPQKSATTTSTTGRTKSGPRR
jgi:hypothetical protein